MIDLGIVPSVGLGVGYMSAQKIRYNKGALNYSQQLQRLKDLSMIIYLLQEVNPESTFMHKFRRLIKWYPQVNLTSMGRAIQH